MSCWNTTLEVTPEAVWLLVRDAQGDEVLKALLPGSPRHPRALLTLLEALALWSGEVLCAAICADGTVVPSPGSHEEELWPEESPLVRFEFLLPRGRGRRLRGVGDFARLRRLGLLR